ncbi:cation:proton antiporter [Afifella pfennigii]|uniref:cation:proton antiporter n=1 Tax=Afifella pfennigii TaxID=209897 RepID=UPI00047BA935|nr:cation:proton antiporter [Afifella pfennigii]
MSASQFLDLCVDTALVLLILAFALITLRIVLGPSLADRVLALDMLVTVGIGFIAVIGVKTAFYLYIDIAIALGLVGFLTTIAFARFVMNRGERSEEKITEADPEARQ